MTVLHSSQVFRRLRWFIETAEGITYRGYWNSSDDKKIRRWSTLNPIRSGLELEDLNGNSGVCVECRGEDFLAFKWLGGVRVIPSLMDTKQKPQILGMQLVTRKNVITVRVNGGMPEIRNRRAGECENLLFA